MVAQNALTAATLRRNVPTPSVLIVARSMPWHIQGGFEEHCWSLAKALTSQGAAVTMVTGAFDETIEHETREGIRVEYVKHLPRNRDKKPMWRWWARFPTAAAKRVQNLGLKTDLFISEGRGGRKLLQVTNVHQGRSVYVSHGTFDQAYRSFSRPELLSRVSRFHPRAIAQAMIARRDFRRDRSDMRRARWVVAVSPFVAASITNAYGVPAQRVRIIGNGVTLPLRWPTQGAARKSLGLGKGTWLLFLGRLEPVKGVVDLVKAVKLQPNLNLVIAGAGPEEQAVKGLLEADRSLRERVKLVGRVSDEKKWDCYAACDLFVLPSKSEGEPISILEALGASRTVVTTRDWVAPDLRGGCIIDLDVGRGIQTALDSKLRIADIARRVGTEHTWDAVAKQYLALLHP